MAQTQHTLSLAHLEEAITVLLCLIDEPARRLLELDLKERPFITLQEERCEYLEAVSGVFSEQIYYVPRHSTDGFHTGKGGRSATEREEFQREQPGG
jgi:hypothetical protein